MNLTTMTPQEAMTRIREGKPKTKRDAETEVLASLLRQDRSPLKVSRFLSFGLSPSCQSVETCPFYTGEDQASMATM